MLRETGSIAIGTESPKSDQAEDHEIGKKKGSHGRSEENLWNARG